nr:hypothetical protein [uncultured Draconibacterium sp.]
MNKKKYFLIIGILLFILIMWICYPFILNLFFDSNNARGLFGDSFGALNSLISGLAFGGIIYTILLQQSQLIMQKEELILQRKELELTRQELNRTAEAQEKSEKALSRQAENMELSSKISALSALFNAYNDLLHKESGLDWQEREKVKEKAKLISNSLEEYTHRVIK